MFPFGENEKFTAIHGSDDRQDFMGVPIRPCPTCGVGRVANAEKVDMACKNFGEQLDARFQTQINASAVFGDGLNAVLTLLGNEEVEAARTMAAVVATYSDENQITFDEVYVRSVFFRELAEFKKEHPRITWEQLRRVVIALYPQMRNKLTNQHALKIACRRAENFSDDTPHGIYKLKTVEIAGKGRVLKRNPVRQYTEEERSRLDQDPDRFHFEQELSRNRALLGKELYNWVGDAQFLAARREQMDEIDRKTTTIFYEFVLLAITQKKDHGVVESKLRYRLRRLASIAAGMRDELAA